MPYLFRTDPGFNMLARGPANAPKDGAAPLEGIVETDWCAATFTMNWKLTRPNTPLTFERDEPFCMIVPVRRGELASCRPRIRPLRDEPAIERTYHAWNASRESFNRRLARRAPAAAAQQWQKHYMRGTSVDGVPGPAHETKIFLREFETEER